MKSKYEKYSDIKLTCPFCKSIMLFNHVLMSRCFDEPERIRYVCENKKCKFELDMKFYEFEKRIIEK